MPNSLGRHWSRYAKSAAYRKTSRSSISIAVLTGYGLSGSVAEAQPTPMPAASVDVRCSAPG